MKTVTLELTEERMMAISKLMEDTFNADSLDRVELLIEIERIFGVEIPDYWED